MTNVTQPSLPGAPAITTKPTLTHNVPSTDPRVLAVSAQIYSMRHGAPAAQLTQKSHHTQRAMERWALAVLAVADAVDPLRHPAAAATPVASASSAPPPAPASASSAPTPAPASAPSTA